MDNDTGDQFWAESSTRHTSLESVESPRPPDDGNCKDAEGQVLGLGNIILR